MANQVIDVSKWIGNNAEKYDPAWAWKQAIEKYPPPPASAHLEGRKKNFIAFMNIFLFNCKDKDVTAVRFDNSMTWANVQKEATGAFNEYTRQGKSWRHPFRSTGRVFGSVACRIEFLLQLIPSGDYSGILCAGLTLVYNAARRKKEIRGMIIRTLDSLSEIIEGSKTFIQMYAWNDELKQRTEDLYIAILEAVEGITEWFKHSPVSEAFKSFIQQSDYRKGLEEKLSRNIEDKASRFSAVIAQCLHATVNTINHNVVTVGQKVEHVGNYVTSVQGRLNEVGDEVVHGLSTVQESVEKLRFDALHSLEEHLHGLARDVQWRFDRLEEREKEHAKSMQQLNKNMLEFGNLLLHQQYQQHQQPQSIITSSRLLALLCLEPQAQNPPSNFLEQMLERIRAQHDFILFHGRQLNPQRLAPVSFVMQNTQFQTWFKSMASQILVVHGMDQDFNSAELVSPLSYMCAMLAQTTGRLNHSYPIAFFCRLHLDARDPIQAPSGMIRSLSMQVLLSLASMQQNPDLSFIGHAEIQAIQAQDLHSLCRLFEELLKRVGVGIIFCMLDATSWFENDIYAPSMHVIMQFLSSLVNAVESSQTGLVFKLIVTNPQTSQYCQYWFPNRVEIYAPQSRMLEAQGFSTLPRLLS